jgi:hypothetical protein
MTKLATYEDLGSPEQLAALIQEFASIKAVWDKSGGESLITGLETVFRELERYRQAEAEGRLVELPCKSGRGHIQQEVRDVRRVYQNIDAECTCKHCQLREGSEGNG